MSGTSRFSTGGLGIVGTSTFRWELVAVCMTVGAFPVWGQCPDEQKLTAFDALADDHFGYSVSVSGDTSVVGAHTEGEGGIQFGSAYVFVRSGGVWTQQQKLTASDAAAGDQFGWSVSVSEDTVVVGAYADDHAGGSDAGSAYVFVRIGGVWTQQQKLTSPDAAADHQFGWSVSVSGDTVVVGARFDDDAGTHSGSAYVFFRSGTVWTQQQKLAASDAAAGDEFGYSVSVSGNTAIVGARGDDDAGSLSGSAYIYVRNGGVWTQEQKLTALDAAGDDLFGWSVALSGDTANVGAIFNDDACPGDPPNCDSGSAYVFVRSGNVWTQQQKLTASDAAALDRFGVSVSVSGNTAVIGASGDGGDGAGSGSAYVFLRTGGTWMQHQHQKLTASDAAPSDEFGNSVSVSGDTVLVGAYQNNHAAGLDAGSAYVFRCQFDGACCVDSVCDLVRQSACETFGGVFFGPSAVCDDVTCPSICDADIIPCPAGDGTVDIFDILGVLDAFSGTDCCAP
ncbi:MAG: hypothetical protein HOP29_07675 [Phycisphaerales bacterium]|nr:hypothetical protein [Phycisphaerales bacterium]